MRPQDGERVQAIDTRSTRRRAMRRRVRRRRLVGALLLLVTLSVAGYSLRDRDRRSVAGTAPQVQAAPATTSAAPSGSPTVLDDVSPASPTATATPAPTARPTRRLRAVPSIGTGRLETVPGRSKVFGKGPLKRYKVEVEVGIGADAKAFAAAVDRTLSDPRSWAAHGLASLQRVDSGEVDFRVVLASPRRTDMLCAPLETESRYSCFQGDRSIINLWRWVNGSAGYGDDLPAYRHYLVNHEVGHALIDNAHKKCPGKGKVAPVMVPQTEGLDGCLPNPWPYP